MLFAAPTAVNDTYAVGDVNCDGVFAVDDLFQAHEAGK
jgi:hypothetical protein